MFTQIVTIEFNKLSSFQKISFISKLSGQLYNILFYIIKKCSTYYQGDIGRCAAKLAN